MSRKGLILLTLVVIFGAVWVSAPVLARQVEGGPGCGIGLGRLRGPQNGLKDAGLALEIDLDDLFALRREGKSLAQIAADMGFSEEELVEKLVAVKASAIDELIAQGKITKETAEEFLLALKERVATGILTEGPCVGNGTGCGVAAAREHGRHQMRQNQGLGDCLKNKQSKVFGNN